MTATGKKRKTRGEKQLHTEKETQETEAKNPKEQTGIKQASTTVSNQSLQVEEFITTFCETQSYFWRFQFQFILSKLALILFLHFFKHCCCSFDGEEEDLGRREHRSAKNSSPAKRFGTVLGQFNVQKLVSSMKASASKQPQESSLLKKFRRHICDKSLYDLGLCGEFFIGHDDTLLVSSELYGEDQKSIRNKAVFNHKFPQHNLTVEAVWPGLFVDQDGSFWDVPLSMGIDLASVASDSGSSYHLSFNHNSGAPKMFGGDLSDQIPRTLLPGFCVKSAMSAKRNIDIWRSKAGKLKMVQPFDVFLSDPHVSASGCIGTVVTASLGENSVRSQGEKDSKDFGSFILRGLDNKSSLLADLFASVSCTAQYGNFQRLFFDLTRIHARLDFPSGSKFITGAAHAAQDIYNSKRPDLDALQAICPDITVSLQQQIFGEFSFRADSRVALDLKSRDRFAHVNDIVFAVEYALKVLGSAKAVAWYSPKNQEAMVELRFFET